MDKGAPIHGLSRTSRARRRGSGGKAPATDLGAAGTHPVWLVAPGLAASGSPLPVRGTAGRDVRQIPLDPSRTMAFGAPAVLRLEPDLGLASCYRPRGGTAGRAEDVLADGAVLLLRPSTGLLQVNDAGRQATVAAREAVMVAAGAACRPVGVERLDYLAVPPERVTPPMRAAAVSLRTFAEADEALQLLGSYGAALLRGLMPMGGAALRAHAGVYMSELVGLMCAGPAAAAPVRPAAPPRLDAIKADIEAGLDDRDMTAARVAAVHGLSVRSVQKLFEAGGETFSGFVLQRRLEKAMRLLQARPGRGPGQGAGAPLSISEIAFEVGFGDLSYFNRTFRRRYGTSPREARARYHAALVGGAGDGREPASTVPPFD